jgi:hypothetical protein
VTHQSGTLRPPCTAAVITVQVQRSCRSPIVYKSRGARNRNCNCNCNCIATAEVDAGAVRCGCCGGRRSHARCCWGALALWLHQGTRCSKLRLRLRQPQPRRRHLHQNPLGRPLLPLSPVCAAALRKRVALRILPSLSSAPRACLPGASCPGASA